MESRPAVTCGTVWDGGQLQTSNRAGDSPLDFQRPCFCYFYASQISAPNKQTGLILSQLCKDLSIHSASQTEAP